MLEIVELARAKGLARIMGLILAHNTPMLRLMGRLDFTMSSFPEDPDFKLATKLL